MNLADFISRIAARYRDFVEWIFPPEPQVFVKCGEKNCMKQAHIKMVDRALDFHIDVCFDHFKELEPQRDWYLE